MRTKLQYILIPLLFVLTGMLCRQPRPEASVHDDVAHVVRAREVGSAASGCARFVAGPDDRRQVFIRLSAAEFTDGALSRPFDQHSPSHVISLFGYSAAEYPAVLAGAAPHRSAPPPGGVAYYIYTLGKIRI